MNIKKEITLNAVTTAEDGTNIAVFHASISTDNPSKFQYTASIIDQNLYKANRERVKADQTAFEDALYEEQARMNSQVE